MPRQKNIKPTTIYWLQDIRPEILVTWPQGLPFYCGKTVSSATRRLGEHIRTAIKKPYGKVGPRLLECMSHVRIVTLEVVPPEEDWAARERHWIARSRAMFPDVITNVSDGGEGPAGAIRSVETRAKIGKVHCGKIVSVETRAKLSAAIMGKKLSPEHRSKIGAGGKGKRFSPEHRAKMSAAALGKKKSPEHIEKMAASKRGKKQSPEHIAKRIATTRARHFPL